MAMITYDNKSTLNPQPSVANVNKVTSDDMNEIKSVVNTNYGEVGDITTLNTTDKTSIVNAINELKDAEIYSTSEVKTNKIWIDGKPIYRKAIEINVGTTEVSYSIANNISQAWIDMGNSWCTWGGNRTYPLPRLMAEYYITNDFKLTVKSSTGTNTGYVVIEYTKTTD
jgi:hypothetical protein